MKKKIGIICACVILALCFGGCNKDKEDVPPAPVIEEIAEMPTPNDTVDSITFYDKTDELGVVEYMYILPKENPEEAYQKYCDALNETGLYSADGSSKFTYILDNDSNSVALLTQGHDDELGNFLTITIDEQ